MSDLNFSEIRKNSQIYTLVFMLKLFAIFFSAMAIFQYIFQGISFSEVLLHFNLLAMLISLVVMAAMLLIWLFLFYNIRSKKKTAFFETPIFFALIITAIILSGRDQSYYKFLFLFIIVSYTIESGVKFGVGLALTASVTVLAIDLIFGKSGNVNPNFENDIALSSMFVAVAWILGYYVQLERDHICHLKEYANIDGLTGIYNHRYFHEEMKKAYADGRETQQPVSLIMIDIDYFKMYNDIYGHQKGDDVLRLISKLLKDNIRPEYEVFRYGGEEFSIILPNADQKSALETADRLRQIVADYPFEGQENLPGGSLTISAGVSQQLNAKDDYTKMIARADSALYRAKYLRRNRVEIYSSVIDRFNQESNDKDERISLDIFHSLKTLISVINSRDSYTYNHIERVVYYCEVMADFLGLEFSDKRDLIYAAYLHDLGKINVSKSILISGKPLLPEEWEELKRHPVESASIVSQIQGMDSIVPIVRQHHERYDGNGYPDNLKGDEITYLARILTLADSFDAMTNDRPYKEKISFDEAYNEIRRNAGKQFDPELSEKFITAIQGR